ncbi:MAG: patatin-like phospholipase family protein [Eubacteriales bacterium]
MLGLALEGGGAKGAYHIGAYRALTEEGLVFDGITGTSIGALNGAMMAQGDFDALEEWWKSADSSALFDVDQVKINQLLNRNIDRETMHYLLKKTRSIIGNRGLDTQRIRKVLHHFIDEDKLRASKVDFGLVTVALSFSNLKPLELYKEDIPEGQIVDYLMASANLPVFKIEPVEGQYFLDGGFYDNCPINLLIEKGYQEIFAIRTLGPGISRSPIDENVKVTQIIPSENIGNVLNFDPKIIKKNIDMGYCDAKRVLSPLAGKRYYLKLPSQSIDYLNLFVNIDTASAESIAERLWLPKMYLKRMILEQIVPETVSFLDLGEDASYQDITLGVLEHLAESCGIPRFSIMNLDSFIAELKKAKRPSNKTFQSDKAFVLNLLAEALLKQL